MIELIYSSHMSHDLELPGIYRLLGISQANNSLANISGLLLFNTRYFLQVLEGEENAVDALFAKIRTDPRHSQVKLMSRQSIQTRHWAQWSMALMTPSMANQAVFRKYCQTDEFSPQALQAADARALMLELSALSLAR